MSVGEDVDGRSDGGGDLITAAGAASPIAMSVRWRPQISRRRVRRIDRRAVTRRYKSSSRVNRWRSDADGVQLLECVKVVATLSTLRYDPPAPSLQLSRKARQDKSTALLPHSGRLNSGSQSERAKPHSATAKFCGSEIEIEIPARRDYSSPSDTSNTVKMPSNRLTYVRPGDMLPTEILEY